MTVTCAYRIQTKHRCFRYALCVSDEPNDRTSANSYGSAWGQAKRLSMYHFPCVLFPVWPEHISEQQSADSETTWTLSHFGYFVRQQASTGSSWGNAYIHTHTHALTCTSTEEEKQTVKFSFRLLTTRQGRSFRLCLGQLTQSMGSFLPVPVDDRFTSGKSVRGPFWSLAVSAVWVSRCAQWSSRLTFQPIGKSGTLCVDWYITLHFAKIEVFCSNSQFTIYRQIILSTR